MLRCLVCNRTGGPFALQDSAQMDGRLLRKWQCTCREEFFVAAGAECTPNMHSPYHGFTVEHQDQLYHAQLKDITRISAMWHFAGYLISITTANPIQRTFIITEMDSGEPGVGFSIHTDGTPADIERRLQKKETGGIDNGLLASFIYRVIH